MDAPGYSEIQKFSTIEKAIGALKPVDPVYCLFPNGSEPRRNVSSTAFLATLSTP